jgi:hypothetical protein
MIRKSECITAMMVLAFADQDAAGQETISPDMVSPATSAATAQKRRERGFMALLTMPKALILKA